MTATGWLRKHFARIACAPMGLVALQSTQAIAQIALATFTAHLNENPLVVGAGHSLRPAQLHATSADAILARNPFDSVTGPFGRANAKREEDAESPPDPWSAPPCDSVRVMAIAASSDPDWSFAELTEGANPHAVLRRRSGEVGPLRVALVGWDRVWMTGPRGLCQAAMFEPRSEPAPRPLTVAQPAVGGAAPVDAWITKGIETISPTEHRIDRGLLPQILEKQAELLHGTKVTLEQVGGKVAGARVSGIAADSLLGKLGVLSGDRLDTINGFPLTSTEGAMEAYAQLQSADHLVLKVNRGGAEVSLQLDIR
jgi:general secretion pathway protein C